MTDSGEMDFGETGSGETGFGETGDPRGRRRATTTIKDSLRALGAQLALLNRQVGDRLAVKDSDLACLDLITRLGPLGPSALARLAGVHPATMTGILDRLERGGWIARERDPSATDRRAVTIRALPARGGEIFALYAGMNGSLDEILAGYTPAELAVLADFLTRATEAGRTATDDLAE
jgi:DNA-binding MarR family transcriptional regulator